MPLRTMRAAFLRQSYISTRNVFLKRYRFQMIRVYAAPRPAFVIDLQAFWNLSVEQFVRKPVGDNFLAFMEQEISITLSVFGSCPQPAPGVRFRRNVLHEPVYGAHWIPARHLNSTFAPMPLARIFGGVDIAPKFNLGTALSSAHRLFVLSFHSCS